ncbi:hypothetical protein FXO38_26691 [Capsicum annuum]|nr:hypothetical protein FXO37_31754 [Capsicum annuum]KAF3631349.1 hypothetical protein FXO38_26691 [Capsicum annuum]
MKKKEVEKRERELSLEQEKKDMAQGQQEWTKNDEPTSCLKGMEKKHLIVGLVNTNPLLSTNHDTSILPSINSSLLQIKEHILLKEDPRRVPVTTQFTSHDGTYPVPLVGDEIERCGFELNRDQKERKSAQLKTLHGSASVITIASEGDRDHNQSRLGQPP